jgi:hypothetical protein
VRGPLRNPAEAGRLETAAAQLFFYRIGEAQSPAVVVGDLRQLERGQWQSRFLDRYPLGAVVEEQPHPQPVLVGMPADAAVAGVFARAVVPIVEDRLVPPLEVGAVRMRMLIRRRDTKRVSSAKVRSLMGGD